MAQSDAVTASFKVLQQPVSSITQVSWTHVTSVILTMVPAAYLVVTDKMDLCIRNYLVLSCVLKRSLSMHVWMNEWRVNPCPLFLHRCRCGYFRLSAIKLLIFDYSSQWNEFVGHTVTWTSLLDVKDAPCSRFRLALRKRDLTVPLCQSQPWPCYSLISFILMQNTEVTVTC